MFGLIKKDLLHHAPEFCELGLILGLALFYKAHHTLYTGLYGIGFGLGGKGAKGEGCATAEPYSEGHGVVPKPAFHTY